MASLLNGAQFRGNQEATAQIRELDIPSRLSRLGYSLDELEGQVGQLANRLGSVSIPRPTEVNRKDEKPVPCMPPLSELIMRQTDRVQSLTRQIQTILAELEI